MLKSFVSNSLQELLNGIKKKLLDDCYSAVYPYYNWMLINIPIFNKLAENELYNELIKHLKYYEKIPFKQEAKTKVFSKLNLTPPEKQELIETLNGDLMDMWKEFESVQPMKKVRLFAGKLNKLAQKYSYSELSWMTEDLIESVDSFDIEKLKNTLKQYPEIILKLKTKAIK